MRENLIVMLADMVWVWAVLPDPLAHIVVMRSLGIGIDFHAEYKRPPFSLVCCHTFMTLSS